jgi:glutamine amidotransferase
MCRLLAVKSEKPFQINPFLERFAEVCKNSKEYQGDGWGCTFLKNNNWKTYKDVRPIWQDDFPDFKTTNILLVHARSAFEESEITVKHNMPFFSNNKAFIFNGELRKVRIKEKGKIGAEKLFNFLNRFEKENYLQSLKKGVSIVEKKSKFIRAMNIVISDKRNFFVISNFNKEPDYFTMWKLETGKTTVICSQPLTGEKEWEKIPNKTIFKV